MTRPLRSTPITGASLLLRAGPPARCQQAAAHLPMFHARAADQAHAASVPDTTWPVIGHPPGPAPAARSMATVSMPLRERNDTSTAVRVHSSSWSPPGTPPVPFPHRSPRRSSANAACGGLEPPPKGDSEGPTFISRTAPTPDGLTYLLIKTSVRRSWRTPRRSLDMPDDAVVTDSVEQARRPGSCGSHIDPTPSPRGGSIISGPLAPPGTRRPRRRGPPSGSAGSRSTPTPRRAYPVAAPAGGSVRRSPASPRPPPRASSGAG
jgi:hypothetical protein